MTRQFSPPPAASHGDLLAALTAAGPPLALADVRGRLSWCSTAFASLFDPPAAAGQTLDEVLGATTAQAMLAGQMMGPWRSVAGGNGTWIITVNGSSRWQAEHARAERLQERLDLVQEFGQTGVFERDPHTLQGLWDAQMYRIWGLPEPPAGSPSPAYANATEMIFPQDLPPDGFAAGMVEPGPHSHRMRIRRPDGQVRHLHSQWKVLLNEQGRPRRLLGVNTDETRAHELAIQAERLRTELDVALDLGHIARWRRDLASGRTFMDRRGCEIIGVPYSEDGMSREDARSRIHPDDLAQADASAALSLRTGEPTDMQLRYPRPGGGWKHVLLRRALQRGPDGQPTGFVGVMLDLTERVEKDHRALDSARRLEAAAEAARIGLWTTEPGTTQPRWNRRMFMLLGIDPRGGPLPLTQWLADCVHPDDRPRVQQQTLAWWHAGNGTIELEFSIVRPTDREQRWVVVRGEVSRGADDGMRRADGVLIDVTEQHHTLRQLRATVERLTLTASALGLGMWESAGHGQDTRWDAQMFKLRGIDSPGRQISRDEAASHLLAEDRLRMRREQRERLGNGQLWHNEFRVVHPDGQVRWITSKSVPILDPNGSEERRIGVNWDSTDTHIAGEALRERERAVAESQAKSQAMSRISHELRTPLNAVLGFTQLLRGKRHEMDAERREQWLGHIEDAARHLLALIDDVLELSRAQVGELRLDCQPVNLSALVDATLPLLAGDAQARDVQLLCEPLAGSVLADPVRLRQVLINLLSNAIKYNRAGGRVQVSSRTLDGKLSLQVSDTGVGIAADRLPHAFEPFNRLGAEASRVEGSGIGLAVVKVLVEHMGGSVEARSCPGQGSEFVVWLPAAADAGPPAPDAGAASAPPPAQPVAPGPPDARPPSRVLYIEDNEVNALLVREILSAYPAVALDVASDGRSGVARAERDLPDLVLVDMQLPDIDGLAVLRALQANPRTAGIACVVLSASATPAEVQAAQAAGFADYWTKPIDFPRFMLELARLLGRPL